MAVGRGSILRASSANAETKEKSAKKKTESFKEQETAEHEAIQNTLTEVSARVPVSVMKEVPKAWGVPKLDKEYIAKLTESVRQFGVLVPLVVYRNERQEVVLLKGYHRFHAAKEAGLKEVPVVFADALEDIRAKAVYDEIQRFEHMEKQADYEVISSITVNMPSYLL